MMSTSSNMVHRNLYLGSQMQPLKSKAIDGFIYNELTRRLTLYMANGHRREFIDVPDYVVDDLIATKSPGRYYKKLIKPKFPQAV